MTNKETLEGLKRGRKAFSAKSQASIAIGEAIKIIEGKPTKQDIDDFKAIYGAQYMLEELYEQGKRGIERLAEFTGLPEGTVASCMEDIFKNFRKNS